MASPLQLYSFIQGEYEDGRKQHDTNRLRSLYQQALAAPAQNQRAIIRQVAGIDPSQAKGLYDLLNSRAEDQRKAVGQRAAMVRALPQDQRQAAYEGIRPDLDEAGLFAPEGADEGYLGAVAQTFGGVSGGQELRPHVIGNALVDASGKVLYQGESPEKWSLVNVPDGQGGTVQMEYSNGQFRTPAYQGSPQPQGITGGGGQVLDDAYRGAQVDPVTDFSTLAQKYPGVQVSSLARSPEHNAKVGGVANSYHVNGQGGDFVVPVAQRPQFMADARQMGYDAIDEGDHVHLEPRRGVQASSRFAPGQGIGGQRMGYTPPKSDQQKQPARRLTPQEIAEHGLAPGTVAYMGDSGIPKIVQRPEKPSAAAGAKPRQLSAEAANKVALYDNAIRAARAWHDVVAEKDSNGNYTGRYNNVAAMSPRAQSLMTQAIRAKLRAESGATITDSEIEGEMERYGPRTFGGDATDLSNASALLKDLVQQRKLLSGSSSESGYSVGQILNVGGKRYRVTDVSDPNDPDLEEVR